MNLIIRVKIVKYLAIIFTLNLCVLSSVIAEEIDTAGQNIEFIAQENNEDPPSDQGSFVYQIIIATFASVIASVMGAISGAMVTEHNIMSDFKPRKLKEGERKNTILLIGRGRTGKTELIKTLSRPLGEERPEITNDFGIYSYSIKDNGSTKYIYDITDYRGQDFSQLISNFIQEQLKRKTKLRYGDINTLILMVDLFPYKGQEDSGKVYNDIDRDRIRDNITQWNRTAIDAIFGLLTQENLKYVCLFINKVDKWKVDLDDQEKANLVKQAYAPLIRDLDHRTSQLDKLKKFRIIIGSVITGKGVIGQNSIYSDLAKYSVPLNNG